MCHRVPGISCARSLVLWATAVLLCGGASPGVGAAFQPTGLAIIGVDVVPMDTERPVLRSQTVIVRDGVIAEIGPADITRVPSDVQRIDGRGRYLMPGLTDAHVHLRDRSELMSYLAHGVTTVIHLSGPTGTIENVLDLRDSVRAGVLLGPTIYSSGNIIDGDPPIFAGVSTVARNAEAAIAVTSAQLRSGVDAIKVYNNLSAGALRAAIATAHSQGVTVFGHIPRVDGRDSALQRALDAGLDVIAHAEEVFFTAFNAGAQRQLDAGAVPTVPEPDITAIAALVKASGAAVIPNLSFVAQTRLQLDDIAQIWSDPEERYLHPDVRAMWRAQNPTTRSDLERFDRSERGKQVVVRRLTRALSAAGVPLLLGTDASAPGVFPGASAHLELQELVAAGLTPYEALATGTVNAGRLLRSRNGGTLFGVIVPGTRADLVLLDGDPLDDVRNARRIVGVAVRGEWYSRARLDSMRAAIAGTPVSIAADPQR